MRYYMHDRAASFRFHLAGALTGQDAKELEQCWTAASSTLGSRAFLVDITGVTAIDDAGRSLLMEWHSQGAQFIAESEWARSLAESITGRPLPAPPAARPTFRGWTAFRAALAASAALVALTLPATVSAADVAVDIEASLPGMGKSARLQAIRSGGSEYRVLSSDGDRMVRQQIIARYLSAEARAQAIEPSEVAISPANYKFRYVATIGSERALAYVYRITPRKKRVGLIQGELWIDASTGLAVRKAGRMVKSPSIFLRRVSIVQDTDLRDGRPYLRITRLDIDTRLAGRAELTITERPCEPERGDETAPVALEASLIPTR